MKRCSGPLTLYIEELSERIRLCLGDMPGIREQKMFGGIAFMLNGNMLVGPMKDGGLMVRVGKDAYETALEKPGAEKMLFTGREMKGFVTVSGDTIETNEELTEWIAYAQRFVETLPAK